MSLRKAVVLCIIAILVFCAIIVAAQTEAKATEPAAPQETLGPKPFIIDYFNAEEENAKSVYLKSRTFVPQRGIDPTLTSPLGNVHVLLQLTKIPSQEERQELERLGVKLLQYIPEHSWFATVRISNEEEILARPYVYYIGPIMPGDKLSEHIKNNDLGSWGTDNKSVAVAVTFFADAQDGERILRKYTSEIGDTIRPLNTILAFIQLENITNLASEEDVQWLDQAPPPLTPTNDGSRAAIGVNTVQSQPYNLNGTGVDILVYDAGRVDRTHADFGGRVIFGEFGNISDHSTHVAGTAAGDGRLNNGRYRGMAPRANIISYYYLCGPYCVYNSTGDILANYQQAINPYGADLATNSIGSNIGVNGYPCAWEGDYELTAMLVDSITQGSAGRPFINIWAAGNERQQGAPCGDYGTIGIPATAKDNIVVGAVNSNDNSMTDFSSWGPTDDGRLRPDVVASGCQTDGDFGITSTLPGNVYGVMCGTSMATPAVSGSIALLLQLYRQIYSRDFSPAMAKALLIHTAQDLGNPGPDFKTGYGIINTTAAVDLIWQSKTEGSLVENFISQGQRHVFYFTPNPSEPIKVTLTWDDPPAAPNSAQNLVNNLDLYLLSPAGQRVYPWTLDPANPSTPAQRDRIDVLNNVEQVVLANATSGTWRLVISGASIPSSPQKYSLAISNQLNVFGNPSIGNTVFIKLSDINYSSSSYLLLMAFGTDTGIPLGDGRVFPLNQDMLLFLSAFYAPLIGLYNSQGFLSNGVETAYWTIPNIPELVGTKVYLAYFTFNASQPYPQSILSISKPIPLLIRSANPTDHYVLKTATLPSARNKLSCAENSATHKIYCFGGSDTSNYYSQILEYNPYNDNLTVKNARLPNPINAQSCVENSATHRIYCFGGFVGWHVNEIFEYNPYNDNLTVKNARLVPSGADILQCAENSATHRIYCFPGRYGGSVSDRIVEYTPANDTLVVKSARLPSRRAVSGCAEDSATHKIYCFGGDLNPGYSYQVLEYEPQNDTIAVKNTTMPIGAGPCVENSLTHKIYCLASDLPQFIEYDPSTNAFSLRDSNYPGMVVWPGCSENSLSHKIYCFGGWEMVIRQNTNKIVEYTSS